jgi:acetoacetyl-CoA synthetase
MKDGFTLNADIQKQIRELIRTQLSPKHIPSLIVQVQDIPYNLNFKKMEILVRRVIHGEDVSHLVSSLQNPDCLEDYRRFGAQTINARL